MHTYTTVALKPNCMSSLLLCAVFLQIFLFFNYPQNNKILIIKIPKDSLFIFFNLNAVYITVYSYHVKAVHDDISSKTVPI